MQQNKGKESAMENVEQRVKKIVAETARRE